MKQNVIKDLFAELKLTPALFNADIVSESENQEDKKGEVGNPEKKRTLERKIRQKFAKKGEAKGLIVNSESNSNINENLMIINEKNEKNPGMKYSSPGHNKVFDNPSFSQNH